VSDYKILRQKVKQLAEREWDTVVIEARIKKLVKEGIPKQNLVPREIVANQEVTLTVGPTICEENNYFLKNCAQATALALMAEFSVGNMESN